MVIIQSYAMGTGFRTSAGSCSDIPLPQGNVNIKDRGRIVHLLVSSDTIHSDKKSGEQRATTFLRSMEIIIVRCCSLPWFTGQRTIIKIRTDMCIAADSGIPLYFLVKESMVPAAPPLLCGKGACSFFV